MWGKLWGRKPKPQALPPTRGLRPLALAPAAKVAAKPGAKVPAPAIKVAAKPGAQVPAPAANPDAPLRSALVKPVVLRVSDGLPPPFLKEGDMAIDSSRQPLGVGAHGAVFHGWIGRKQGDPLPCVIKEQELRHPGHRLSADNEVACQREVVDKRLVSFLGATDSGRFVYTATELCATSLRTVTRPPGQGPRPAFVTALGVLRWAEQVLEGLAALHEAGWVHNDIKHDNVLVRDHATMDVVLTDFGSARRVDEKGRCRPGPGTPGYSSLESLEGKYVDGRADVWSVGVMVLETLLRRPFPGSPFAAGSADKLELEKLKVKRGVTDAMWAQLAYLDEEVRWLISVLLEKDPRKRPTAAVAATLVQCVHANQLRLLGKDYPGAASPSPSPPPATPSLSPGTAATGLPSSGADLSEHVATPAPLAASVGADLRLSELFPASPASTTFAEEGVARAGSPTPSADDNGNSLGDSERIFDTNASCTPSLMDWIISGLPP